MAKAAADSPTAPHAHDAAPQFALPEAATGAARLAACKAFLAEQTAALRAHHAAGAGGRQIARERADTLDALLRALMLHAVTHYPHGALPAPMALLALGGYGRRELCPLSDVDILFLYPSDTPAAAIKPLQEHLIAEVLYPLWDCGLKVGHYTRTLEEVFGEARGDIRTKTSLLEARYLSGSRPLANAFCKSYRHYFRNEGPLDYIAQRLADQAARRAKASDTVFLQEPDIKNGVGGLRDYQNTLWMAQVKLGITEMRELVELGYLREGDHSEFERSYDFLLRVRSGLHFLLSHPSDLMDLAIQPVLASELGYPQVNDLERVEVFMRDYYRCAHTIYRLSLLVEDRLALALDTQDADAAARQRAELQTPLVQRLDGFLQRGNKLAAESPEVFRADPARLIRVFRHCQQLGCRPDFALAELIRQQSAALIDDALRCDRDACQSFRAILGEVGNVYPTLDLMHELGVLGLFIPEFGKLTCLVQHELYHRYTVDVHTLKTIRELDRLFAADAEPAASKYRQALHETATPQLLYLILLLHDIGKGVGVRGHDESGVRISRPILHRLGLPESKQQIALYIIKNHLLMGRFCQTRDVDDPQTAAALAEHVGDPDRLRYLYVHTFCDARGVGESLWNEYKDLLHTRLYRRTMEHLRLGDDEIQARYLARRHDAQRDILARQLPDISEDEVAAHFDRLQRRYSIYTEPDEIALHLQMVHRLLHTLVTDTATPDAALRPIVEWQNDLNRSHTTVHIVTWDRAGLFYKLAGALSAAGLSILSAKVHSRSDHIAIDSFTIIEPGRGLVQNPKARAKFEQAIRGALLADRDLYPQIVAEAEKHISRYLRGRDAGPHTAFPPSVEIYHEEATDRTVVEIQAADQIGLLFRLAKTIFEHGYNITWARIATEHGIALDAFYIEPNESARSSLGKNGTGNSPGHTAAPPTRPNEAAHTDARDSGASAAAAPSESTLAPLRQALLGIITPR
ncbi:uridylyltransferase [Cephaloticoccus primus]|uniref:Bifunctional uridylyltransferase/uridylyl-removing enzyme n=1 Tax=Cephaloticoccus primus TaxID=1548207 RepID=A0A139SIU8_9BACT|nr:[protein-PII] uridylyltransferase [Cephaloticoccus primus]KXU34400.1 uridylyltransferase [Cephaloticoccus primus]